MARNLSIFLLICFLGLFGWFYLGFFSPDPLALGGIPLSEQVPPALLFIWVVLPLAALTVVLTIGAVIFRVVSHQMVLVACVAATLAALLVFPIASEFYYARLLHRDLSGFNSTLQLHPPLWTPRVPRADLRIAFLGGSTTAWPDSQGVGWPARVEASLQERFPDITFEAANVAKEWYTTQHSLLNYSANVRHHRPEIVVIMHAINDLLLNADFSSFSQGNFRLDYGHFLGPTRDLIRRPTLLDALRRKLKDYWYHQPREIITPENYPGLVSYRRNLESLADLVRASGAELVVLNQPHLYRESLTDSERARLYMLNVEAVGADRRWTFEAARDGMRAYNDAARRFASERRLSFVDVAAAVPQDLEHFNDDVHYTDRSFPLVAAAVAAGLTPVVEEFLITRREGASSESNAQEGSSTQ